MQEFDASLNEFLALGLPSLILGMFLGPAFGRVSRSGWHGRPMNELRDRADDVTGGQIQWPGRTNRTYSTSEQDTLAPWFVGAFVVIALYLKYRNVILIGLLFLALGVSVIAVTVLTVASRRGVVSHGAGRATAFLIPILFTGVGTTVVAFLWNPPAGGREFREFIDVYQRTGGFDSLEGLMFVAYQVLGAIAFIALAIASILFSLATLAAIYVAVDAWGQWLWQSVHRLIGGFASPWILGICAFFALVSLALCGGWAFEWATSQPKGFPTIPSTPLPTVSP